jgi:hypothetical protein
MAATGLQSDRGRARIINQLLLLVDSVHRSDADPHGVRFSPGPDVDTRWQKLRAALGKLSIHWSEATQRYVFANGTALPPRDISQYQRAIWQLPLADTTEAKLVLERRDPEYVVAELRVSVAEGKSIPAATLRIVTARDDSLLAELAIPGLGVSAPHSSSVGWSASGVGQGMVQSRLIPLAEGKAVVADLTRGSESERSPALHP